jgi:hypothetical protein
MTIPTDRIGVAKGRVIKRYKIHHRASIAR